MVNPKVLLTQNTISLQEVRDVIQLRLSGVRLPKGLWHRIERCYPSVVISSCFNYSATCQALWFFMEQGEESCDGE